MATAICYAHPHEVSAAFHDSLVNMMLYDFEHDHILTGGHISMSSGPRIASARNDMVRAFLGHPSRPEWLWMVDADMVFAPDIVYQLLAHADPDERPIVGGLCFAGGRSGKVWPTLYSLAPGADGPVMDIIDKYPADTLVRVDGTGAACLLMHRGALERIGDTIGGAAPWFAEAVHGQMEFGEDITFCMRAGALGIPIHVHTGIQVGHVKPSVIDEDTYFAYRIRRKQIGDEGVLREYVRKLRLAK